MLQVFFFSLILFQAVGDAFNEGLYEEQARLRGIPLLESRPKNLMRKMTAKEACGNQKVRKLCGGASQYLLSLEVAISTHLFMNGSIGVMFYL